MTQYIVAMGDRNDDIRYRLMLGLCALKCLNKNHKDCVDPRETNNMVDDTLVCPVMLYSGIHEIC